jgi:hypothetical protein
MLNHRVGRRVSVSQEDQFQRNGVILDQRSGVWNDDTGAVSRAGGAALLASLKSLQRTRQGRRVQKETLLRALPHPWHPCCPDLPRYPAGPRGERAREPWLTTQPTERSGAYATNTAVAPRTLPPFAPLGKVGPRRKIGRPKGGEGGQAPLSSAAVKADKANALDMFANSRISSR